VENISNVKTPRNIYKKKLSLVTKISTHEL